MSSTNTMKESFLTDLKARKTSNDRRDSLTLMSPVSLLLSSWFIDTIRHLFFAYYESVSLVSMSSYLERYKRSNIKIFSSLMQPSVHSYSAMLFKRDVVAFIVVFLSTLDNTGNSGPNGWTGVCIAHETPNLSRIRNDLGESYLRVHRRQQQFWMFHLTTVSLSGFLHDSVHRRTCLLFRTSRLFWICLVLLVVWILLWRLLLLPQDVCLWEGSSQKLQQSLGFSSVLSITACLLWNSHHK